MAFIIRLQIDIRASRSRWRHLRVLGQAGFLQASTPVMSSIPYQFVNVHYLHNNSVVRTHINEAVSIIRNTVTTFGKGSSLRFMTNLSEGLRQPCRREREPLVPFEGSIQEPKLFKKELHHLSKKKGPSCSGTKTKSLVKILMPLSNVKEEVYKALDEWVAFEQEFPVVAVRKTLQRLKKKELWQRIIQVSKWMLSKGQGQTLGTYDLMLKAYDMDARLEDAEILWDKLLKIHTRSMPKNMFIRMMSIYKRREMPEKLLEVYNQMEKVGIKPDSGTLQRVGEVYMQLGMPEKQEELSKDHPPIFKYFNAKGKTSAATEVPQVPEADGMSRLNDSCRFGEKSKKDQLNFRGPDEEHNIGLLSETSHKDDLRSVDKCDRLNLKVRVDDHEDFVNQIIATM